MAKERAMVKWWVSVPGPARTQSGALHGVSPALINPLTWSIKALCFSFPFSLALVNQV